jgi:hypothetical protein
MTLRSSKGEDAWFGDADAYVLHDIKLHFIVVKDLVVLYLCDKIPS